MQSSRENSQKCVGSGGEKANGEEVQTGGIHEVECHNFFVAHV